MSVDDKLSEALGKLSQVVALAREGTLFLNSGLILNECFVLDDPHSQQDFQKKIIDLLPNVLGQQPVNHMTETTESLFLWTERKRI